MPHDFDSVVVFCFVFRYPFSFCFNNRTLYGHCPIYCNAHACIVHALCTVYSVITVLSRSPSSSLSSSSSSAASPRISYFLFIFAKNSPNVFISVFVAAVFIGKMVNWLAFQAESLSKFSSFPLIRAIRRNIGSCCDSRA